MGRGRASVFRGFQFFRQMPVGVGRGSWHIRCDCGGVWNPGLRVGLGREFIPLATLGVTEGGVGRPSDRLRAKGGCRGDPSTGSEGTEGGGRGIIIRPVKGRASVFLGRPFERAWVGEYWLASDGRGRDERWGERETWSGWLRLVGLTGLGRQLRLPAFAAGRHFRRKIAAPEPRTCP